jgi:hypothetical protein
MVNLPQSGDESTYEADTGKSKHLDVELMARMAILHTIT